MEFVKLNENEIKYLLEIITCDPQYIKRRSDLTVSNFMEKFNGLIRVILSLTELN